MVTQIEVLFFDLVYHPILIYDQVYIGVEPFLGGIQVLHVVIHRRLCAHMSCLVPGLQGIRASVANTLAGTKAHDVRIGM